MKNLSKTSAFSKSVLVSEPLSFLRSLIPGPLRFNCWVSFYPVYFCNVLLSPYHGFISFLYLGLDVLGDNASIS